MSFGLESATVVIGGEVALEGVDVVVEPGRVTAVIGADGAGKTTTSRTLVGLVAASAGRVTRPDDDSIAYQPESAGTWADLTVAENLAFVAAVNRVPASNDRSHDLIAVTGLEAATDRLAGALSGGMRQKLAVAMAMLARPRLTVLDEPTTGLDPLSRAEVWRLIAQAAGEGSAVLVTTTYLEEAERASHVVVLDEGRVLTSGTAASIRASFPGAVGLMSSRPDGLPAWRRGNRWRVWSRSGQLPDSAFAVDPDLEDVVTAAALSKGSAS